MMNKRSANFVTVALPLTCLIAFGLSLATPNAVLAQRTDVEAAEGLPSSAAEPSKRYSLEQVLAEFAALKKEDVAWRKIDWKTCLLDGLQASRKQHKPILLWIFIDRPIDDERC